MSGTIRETNLNFVWLEITGKCQLERIHCYAESSPSGTNGVMEHSDWLGVIDQCADLGVQMVQFIGGEPTLHPDLPLRRIRPRAGTTASDMCLPGVGVEAACG